MGQLLCDLIGYNDRSNFQISTAGKNFSIEFNCIFNTMRRSFLFITVLLMGRLLPAQQLKEIIFDPLHPISIKELKCTSSPIAISLPLFSIEINKQKVNSNEELFAVLSKHSLHLFQEQDENFEDGYKATIVITNSGRSPVTISNIIPFGAAENHYYISGKPLTDTSRSFLYQPTKTPIGVIIPHNSNDLNFTAVELENNKVLFGLIRRDNDSIQNYLLQRSPYVLQPGKKISFHFYADVAEGDWRAALKKCF